jgi:Flp pilus assembly CpaE family ATPase
VESVLDAARGLSDCVVVDCGFSLETDEELSFDTLAPRRNGATLAVLDAADVIIVVGSADPIGVQRLVRGLGELRELDLPVVPWVVLNRVRRGVVPGDPVAELTGALERFAGCRPTAFLPLDHAAVDAALARGKTLAETSRRGPLRAALVELAGAVAGVPTAGRRRR